MISMIGVNDIRLTFARKSPNKSMLQKAKNIITRFGQFKLVLVRDEGDGQYGLISGAIILQACRELDLPNVYCYVWPKNTDTDDMQCIRLIQNTPRDLDVLQTAMTIDSMSTYQAVDRLANVLPFSRKELRNFKDLKDFDWASYDNDIQHFQTSLFE